ncbi:MAG: hypothetical protein KF691_09770 [Phycisphaeraceae bacterium]|nr:hypothetical protein [Phycisphaeraceae bacterium]
MNVRSLQMLAMGVVAGAALSAQAVVVSVGDSNANWLGFMNVFELPENGGGYVFGSPWGVDGLRAEFNDGAATVTLFPNSVDDPSPFWYTPMGEPGSVGNKQMDANLYHEVSDGSLSGVPVTFEGTVNSNSFTSSHVAKIFIRDFAPDYSSFNEAVIDLVPGPFSLTLETEPDPARHVQWGFNVNGPCVWITDVGPYGNAVIATGAPATCTGDLNGDGFVDDSDFVLFAAAYNILDCTDPMMPTGCPADFNDDDFVDDSDFVLFVAAYNELICP